MTLNRREVDGYTVLELAGTLDVVQSPRVRDQVLTLIDQGSHHLVLDLGGVERVFSSGLSALLAIHKAAAARGGQVVFCSPRPFLREVLRITMLDRIFRLAPDQEGAVEYLRQG